MIYSILAVELTLKWNHVSDVYEVRSTGQLLPLIGGVVLLICTCWQICRDRVSGNIQSLFVAAVPLINLKVHGDKFEAGRGFQLENGSWV